MRLLYLYVQDYGIFRREYPVEMNFTGEYRFSMQKDDLGHLTVRCEAGVGVPKSFYSLKALRIKDSVAAISAIVGGNGSGKSTIGTLLSIIRGSSSKHREVLLIWEKDGAWNLYTTISNFDSYEGMPILSGGPECRLVTDTDELLASFDYVYYSPHFEPDNAFEQVFDSSACCNISTSALFFTRPDKVLNKDLTRGESASFIRRAYELEQNLWIGRFLKTRPKWGAVAKKLVDLPTSMLLAVYLDNDATQVSSEYFLERIRNETIILDESKRVQEEHLRELRSSVVEIVRGLEPNKSDFGRRFLINYVLSFLRSIETRGIDEESLFTYGRIHDCLSEVSKCADKDGLDVASVLSGISTALKEEDVKSAKKFTAAKKLFERLRRGATIDADGNHVANFRLYEQANSAVPYLDERGLVELFDLYLEAVSLYDFLEYKYTPSMSAGELVMLRMLSRFYWYLNPLARGGEGGVREPKRDVLIFLDEVETALHPEWQRSVVLYLTWFFGKFAPERKVHLIFATHSPILLSDIPAKNCVFLERVQTNSERPHSRVRDDVLSPQLDFSETFMANVQDLYSLPFFLKEGCAGRFASEKVREALNPHMDIEEDERKRVFFMIGDPVVRRVVEDTWRLQKITNGAKLSNTAKTRIR